MTTDTNKVAASTISPKVVAASGSALVLAVIAWALDAWFGVSLDVNGYAILSAVVVGLSGYMTPDRLRELGANAGNLFDRNESTRRVALKDFGAELEFLKARLAEVRAAQTSPAQSTSDDDDADTETTVPADEVDEDDDYEDTTEVDAEADDDEQTDDAGTDEPTETADEPAESDADDATESDEPTDTPTPNEAAYEPSGATQVTRLLNEDGTLAGVMVNNKFLKVTE